MRFIESEVVGASALRFDGWKYLEAHPFDVDEALGYFFRTGSWDIMPLQQMTVFFVIARAMRWNLEYEPKNGRYWRAFRTLFLTLAGLDVPEQYRHAEGYARWKGKREPHFTEFLKRVEAVHRATRYDDNASLADRLLSEDHPLLLKVR